MTEFEGLSDHFILRMYEFIRHEVQADAVAGARLVGLAARRRSDLLFKEIERRNLFCEPIDWPEHLEPGADKCAPAGGRPKTISNS